MERELSEFNKKNLEGNDAFIKREEKISYMDDLFSFKLGFTSLVNSLKKFKVDYLTVNNENKVCLKEKNMFIKYEKFSRCKNSTST